MIIDLGNNNMNLFRLLIKNVTISYLGNIKFQKNLSSSVVKDEFFDFFT